MKKSIIFFLFYAIALSGLAQVKTVSLLQAEIGPLFCKYYLSIDIEKKDTAKYVFIGFQNKEYSAIVDTKSVFFTVTENFAELLEFNQTLKTALPEMGNKSSISWVKSYYSVYLHDFNTSLYLKEPDSAGDGYTTLTKKQVEKLIIWIESLSLIHI